MGGRKWCYGEIGEGGRNAGSCLFRGRMEHTKEVHKERMELRMS